MFQNKKILSLTLLLFLILPNQSQVVKAASFNDKISKIQKEINNNEVKEATRLLKKMIIVV